MRLSKKLLIFFGIFLLTINIISFTGASVPSECIILTEHCIGPVCIPIPTWGCKKVVSGEVESFHLYSTIFSIKNNAQVNYFIPYFTESERVAFLNSAIANPSLEVTPDIGNMCFKRCIKEGGTCSFSGTTYIFYASGGIGISNGVYTMSSSSTKYHFQLATNSIGCNNAVFGDPKSGSVKYCYYPVACPGATSEDPSSGSSSGDSSGGSSGGSSSGGTTASTCVSPLFECGGSCCGPSQKCYQNSCCTPSYPPSSSSYSCGDEYLANDGCGGSHSGVGSDCPDDDEWGSYSCTSVGCVHTV